MGSISAISDKQSPQVHVLYIGPDVEAVRNLIESPKPHDPISPTITLESDMLNACRALERRQSALILLDMDIPEGIGFQRLNMLGDVCPETPIVCLVTGEASFIAQEALLKGAQDYLIKDETNWNLLLHTIRHVLDRWNATAYLRKQKKELVGLRQEYQAILRSTPNGLCMLNPDWSIRWANYSMYRLLDVGAPETMDLTGQSFAIFFKRQADFEQYCALARQGVRMQGIDDRQWRLYRLDGTPFYAHLSIVRLDPAQTDPGYAITISDITDNVNANEQLRQTKEKLQIVYDGMADGLIIADCETRQFYQVNDAICRMLGYTREEMHRLSVDKIHPPSELPNVIKMFEIIKTGKIDYIHELPCLHKDGRICYMDLGAKLIQYNDRLCSIGFFRDLTALVEAEKKLRFSEERLRLLVEQIPAIIWTTGRDLTLQSIQGVGLKSIGLETQPFLGKPLRVFIRNFLANPAKGALNLGKSSKPSHDEEKLIAATKNAIEGKRDSLEIFIRPDTYFHVCVEPLRDSDGAIKGTMALSLDVSERKRLMTALIQEERLAAIGGAMDSIAHCMKNLITIQNNGIGLLKTAMDGSNWAPAALAHEMLNKSSRRLSLLLMNMMDYSQIREITKEEIQIPALLQDVIKHFEFSIMSLAEESTARTAPHDVQFVSRVEKGAEVHILDSQRVFRALLNLGNNAIDAMPKGGTLTLTAERISPQDERLLALPPDSGIQQAESYLMIAVSDTGIGIPQEIQKKIFDPFFTNKGSKGTGLGLASVKQLIADHGGAISVESKPGAGSVFRIFLP